MIINDNWITLDKAVLILANQIRKQKASEFNPISAHRSASPSSILRMSAVPHPLPVWVLTVRVKDYRPQSLGAALVFSTVRACDAQIFSQNHCEAQLETS